MRPINPTVLVSTLLAAGVSSAPPLNFEATTGRIKLPPTHAHGKDGFRPIIQGGISDGHAHFTIPFRDPRSVYGANPGEFNMYIFAMSWKAEWCYHEMYPGCQTPRQFWEDNLTIHGLWPDYGDGTYPTLCTKEKFDHERVVDAVGMDVLEDVWPNIQVAEDSTLYDSFWQHEWAKHGTCTGLTQEEYFSTGVSLLKERFPTPAQLSADAGGSITRAELEAAYGGDGMAILVCQGHNTVYLNQVFLCLEVDPETHKPGEQIVCPEQVVEHDDSCGQGTIHVGSF